MRKILEFKLRQFGGIFAKFWDENAEHIIVSTVFKDSTASFLPIMFNHCLLMPITVGGKEDPVKFSLFCMSGHQ